MRVDWKLVTSIIIALFLTALIAAVLGGALKKP